MKMDINSHFKRESKIMLWFMIAPIIIGLLVAVILPYVLTESKIDVCLDGGGSFNYDICQCDYSKNHEHKDNHRC